MARRSSRAVLQMIQRGITTKDIITDASIRNALVIHAAFGGSTNLIMHLGAVAYHAGVHRPTVEDWARVNQQVPRLVDALPNGPKHHPTVQVFLAGGVPEVMLHLRRAGLLDTQVLTVTGRPLGEMLDWWETSERRVKLREVLRQRDGVDPDDVIMSPDLAAKRGLTSTVCFPKGNLAPGGSVIKSTAIDPSVVGENQIYRKVGPARVFTTEPAVIKAIKTGGIKAGDIIILCARGPLGSGMEETYQVTSALKMLPFGKHVAVITDARFSGVSTGACIGHVTPEALAGGPIGKLHDDDQIEIVVDQRHMTATVNLLGADGTVASGDQLLASRAPRADLQPDPMLPSDTRLWAALQDVSGGSWGGAVYDVEQIIEVLDAGKKALGR